MSGELLRADGVSKTYRRGGTEQAALREVSLSVPTGCLTVLAGPSGSGKTTLLSILGGYERPDAGLVTIFPPLPAVASPAALSWSHAGYLPQALALMDELTVAENVQLPARLAGDPGDDRQTGALLERLELTGLAGRYPSHTSGGEQQRAALARALRLRPPLLLADEPTGQQDRARVELVLDVLAGYAHSGHAVVVTSHDPTVIKAADQVIALRDGRVEVGRH